MLGVKNTRRSLLAFELFVFRLFRVLRWLHARRDLGRLLLTPGEEGSLNIRRVLASCSFRILSVPWERQFETTFSFEIVLFRNFKKFPWLLLVSKKFRIVGPRRFQISLLYMKFVQFT